MFDVGFSELVLLLVIGLLVLGPERLPRAARTIGAYVRKARGAWHQVKYDIDRELQASEMRQSWRDSMAEANKDLEQVRDEMNAGIQGVDEQVRAFDRQARDEAQAIQQQINPTDQPPATSDNPGSTSPAAEKPRQEREHGQS